MQPELTRIAQACSGRTAADIAAAVHRLVRTGELAAGTRLPTVRALAQTLGTSPTTVGEAWRTLIRTGAVRTEGRNGSFVAAVRRPGWPSRFWRIAAAAGEFALDLSAGVPDPELLPDPRGLPGAGHVTTRSGLSGYLDPPVLPELERLVRAELAGVCEPESLTVVDGSLDAVDRVLSSLVSPGDRVLVESPTFPPFLDLLDLLGARAVAVEVDAAGMRADALAHRLRTEPEAATAAVVLLQPRAHNPTGASMTRRRAEELAAVLVTRAPRCLVVEDDHAGQIATAEPAGLATRLPDRTVSIRSYSKSHGPDLRLAAVAGPRELIEPVVARRNLGPAWSSRLLQDLLVRMLTDPGCTAAVARAREVYRDRREALTGELAARGIEVIARDGFNLWVPVADERDALVLLAARGIGAAPGRPFLTPSPNPAPAGGPDGGDHLRVTTALLPVGEAARVADALADASTRPALNGSRV